MGLFELKNNLVVIEPQNLFIPEMKSIWDRDKSKTKDKAYKELSYIYYLVDYKSPYNSYPEDHREEIIIKDFIRDDKWKPDELITNAILKYSEFQETPSMRLMKAAKKAQDRITKYLDTGEGSDDIKELMMVIKEIGKAVESVDKIEDKVKKEITSSEKIRGGGQIKNRER